MGGRELRGGSGRCGSCGRGGQHEGEIIAQVAEVAMRPDGTFAVERVVCAVDCGVPVNPDIIRAQMEGGIGFGSGTVLKSALHLEGGRVVETNYDAFEVLRIDGMPKVEVHIVPSDESPTGVGEPGVPPIGPALANAYFVATGKLVTTLPFSTTLAIVIWFGGRCTTWEKPPG